jgi:FKBP12-rapamycin complex-associated protein
LKCYGLPVEPVDFAIVSQLHPYALVPHVVTPCDCQTDMVEDSIAAAVDSLKRASEPIRCVAAMHVLNQLAINAPTYFYVHVGDFFDVMWRGLCDSKEGVRFVTIDGLSACLNMVAQRKIEQCQAWYADIYTQATTRLSKPNRDVNGVHGSLMVIEKLIRLPHARETFIDAKMQLLMQILLPRHFADHKERAVRRQASYLALSAHSLRMPTLLIKCSCVQFMALLPALHLSASPFGPKIEETMRWFLLVVLRKSEERAAAFNALGELASMQAEVADQVDNIFGFIKDSLNSDSRRSRQEPCTDEALFAVQMIVQANGWRPELEGQISDLLPSLFEGGLSESLKRVLTAIVNCMSYATLHRQVHERLLGSISNTLTGISLPQSSSRMSTNRSSTASSMKGTPLRSLTIDVMRSSQLSISPGAGAPDGELIRLALSILGSFDFGDLLRVQAINQTVVRYLNDDEHLTRVEAALCCCKTLLSMNLLDSASEALRNQILERCLVLAATDPEEVVRESILSSMNGNFDDFLSEDRNLRLVLVPLNDEALAVRKIATTLLGRLGRKNPSYIMPTFRKMLVQLLTELEHNNTQTRKEEAAQLLTTLIRSSEDMVQPYATPIAQSLIAKLKEKKVRARVAARMLEALGELAQMGAEQMQSHLEPLLDIIIQSLQDQSSVLKREIALRALRQLVSGTGAVIQPYLDKPALMDILRRIIRREAQAVVRDEAVKALGTLGAIDPLMLKRKQRQHAQDINTVVEVAEMTAVNSWGTTNTGEEYYVSQTLKILIQILNSNSLIQYHNPTVMVLMFIVKSVNRATVMPFLPKVVPPFLRTIYACNRIHRAQLMEKLTELVILVRNSLSEYLGTIVELVVDCWPEKILLVQVLHLIQRLSEFMPTAFKPHMPSLLPHLTSSLRYAWLEVLNGAVDVAGDHCHQILDAFVTFGSMLEDYLYLILPQLLSIVSHRMPTVVSIYKIKLRAVQTIGSLCEKIHMFEYTSRIVLPLVRVLKTADIQDQFRIEIVNTLYNLISSVGYDFAIFVPVVESGLSRLNGQSASLLSAELMMSIKNYDALVSKLLASEFEAEARRENMAPMPDLSDDEDEDNRLPVDYDKLAQSWNTSQRSTQEDWTDWLWRFSIELLRQSPSPALRNCEPLAQLYKPLASEIFQTAFAACWTELYDSHQTELVYNLEVAFKSSTIPPHVLQMLLNLAEFMEQHEKPLPIDIRTLAELAQKCQTYAKALHYWQLQFSTSPETAAHQLITINTELQQPESATGMLITLQKIQQEKTNRTDTGMEDTVGEATALEREAEIYEKLHQWENALHAYERRQAAENSLLEIVTTSSSTDATGHGHVQSSTLDAMASNAKKSSPEILLKRMRCLNELGAWGELSQAAATVLEDAKERVATQSSVQPNNILKVFSRSRLPATVEKNVLPDVRQSIASNYMEQVAPYAAAAAWNLERWEDMQFFAEAMDDKSEKGAFFRTISAIHKEDWANAKFYIEKTRNVVNQRLFAAASQTYARAYDVVFDVQKLIELEEVIEYHDAIPSRQKLIRRMWDQRLLLCETRVEFWQQTLPMRALVIPPEDDIIIRLKFAALCRKRGRVSAAKACLATVMGLHSGSLSLDSIRGLHQARPAVIFAFLKLNWLMPEQQEATLARFDEYLREWDGQADAELLAKCHRKAANWRRVLPDPGYDEILASFKHAIELTPTCHKAWHAWALMNYEEATRQEDSIATPDRCGGGSYDGKASDKVVSHMGMAVQGFFQSVQLPNENGNKKALQDVLRLLTVWFRYGESEIVHEAVEQGLRDTSIDTWVQVIPQIVARIDIPRKRVRSQIKNLLIRVGEAHPQVLLFPLLVSTKASSEARKRAAWAIIDEMRKFSRQLIEEAELVSRELDRVAVLWNEEWHAGLEEACKQYFTHGNAEEMLGLLDKLHETLRRGPETLREISFQQSFGSQLYEAAEWIDRYRKTKSRDDLNRAWNIYFKEFQKIAKTLNMSQLELQYVSERLFKANDLELAVPGTYRADRPEVCIISVSPLLDVLPSKQRPRKLMMKGSDGRDYEFLLKGKEDIRLDERVMQLFGLINTMLATDVVTSRRDLAITRYDVVPLSPTSGLIGWVGGCDTLNALIKGYREARNIRHHVEQGLMLQCAPRADITSYDKLSLMGKVEAFEWAQSNTTGNDLKQILWLSSKNSEIWLERQTMYIRSLAAMSMVGYVLGLGDRHPSNLMLHRNTGKIVHIDFGDCFEVSPTTGTCRPVH